MNRTETGVDLLEGVRDRWALAAVVSMFVGAAIGIGTDALASTLDS